MFLSEIPIRCLTLDKRYDKFIELQKRGNSLGLKIEGFFAGDGKSLPDGVNYNHIDVNTLPPMFQESTGYPAWWRSPAAYNAWLCHRKIFIDSLNNNDKFLWLMEDDAIIQEDFTEIIEQCSSFLLNVNWSALYLGWFSNGHLLDIGHKYIYRIIGGAGFHSIVLSKDMLEELVRFPPIGPFDEITAKYLLPSINAFAVYPCIVTQDDGYSYIEGGNLTKPDRYKK